MQSLPLPVRNVEPLIDVAIAAQAIIGPMSMAALAQGAAFHGGSGGRDQRNTLRIKTPCRHRRREKADDISIDITRKPIQGITQRGGVGRFHLNKSTMLIFVLIFPRSTAL